LICDLRFAIFDFRLKQETGMKQDVSSNVIPRSAGRMSAFQSQIANRKSQIITILYLLTLLPFTGCLHTPSFVPSDQQQVIDRAVVDMPTDTELRVIATGLTAPTAICFDESDGTMFIANNAHREGSPHIFARKRDGTQFDIYPVGRHVPGLDFLTRNFRVFGPIGGMVFANGKLYVTHRDGAGLGVVTAFGMDGSHNTVIAGLPTQGDYGLTDIVFNLSDGRLYFGIGAATNSGVVGLDNWQIGWVRKHPEVCDKSAVELELTGIRFDAKNPDAGLGAADIAVTAPFQPFGTSDLTTILPVSNNRPNGAVLSVSTSGGDPKIEAYGLHNPRGLAFGGEYAERLFCVNDGMELRGTRPVKNDPDALIRIPLGRSATFCGWPDFSTDFIPITDSRFQEESLLRPSGYRNLRMLIDRDNSNLPNRLKPPDRDLMLHGVFPSQAGAAKLAFVRSNGTFKQFHGSAIVALSGDRAPFATSGYRLREYFGNRVVRVDVDEKTVSDFVVNTRRMPASKLGRGVVALERPIDVKFGPDGAIYILDFGQMIVNGGQEKIVAGSGRIFRLAPVAATQPTTR
jgi:glucose/arabinose dehydrogenase